MRLNRCKSRRPVGPPRGAAWPLAYLRLAVLGYPSRGSRAGCRVPAARAKLCLAAPDRAVARGPRRADRGRRHMRRRRPSRPRAGARCKAESAGCRCEMRTQSAGANSDEWRPGKAARHGRPGKASRNLPCRLACLSLSGQAGLPVRLLGWTGRRGPVPAGPACW
jgi:hypothetical protein